MSDDTSTLNPGPPNGEYALKVVVVLGARVVALEKALRIVEAKVEANQTHADRIERKLATIQRT